MTRPLTTTARQQRESQDSIGLGKLTDGHMKGCVELIKKRGLLKEPAPAPTGDRGIVIAGGGKYLSWAWVNAKWLRTKGVTVPIQVWFLGPKEMPRHMRPHFEALGVELVDALEVRKEHWMRNLGGWELKAFCAARCPFDEVCFVDADCLLSVDPATVWDDPDYQEKGALFFSDIAPCRKNNWHYFFAGVPIPEKEFESGVFFWNRQRSWPGILFTMWILEHSDVWFKMSYGDKECFYLGFETTKTPFVQSMTCEWNSWGISQQWKGEEVAKHVMAAKRGEAKLPDLIIDRLFEQFRSFQ